jgi:putative FmdB family regulatory protein
MGRIIFRKTAGMPTYKYRCNNCGHQFEARQRMTDDPLSECPVCGGDLRRVVGSVGIVFKGNGFYVTDHRNGSGRVQTPEKTEKPAESKPADSESTDSKDKPDTTRKTDKASSAAGSSAGTAAASAG